MPHPPGPRGRDTFGFLGNGSLGGTLLFLKKTAEQYGPVTSFRILNKRIYLVDDADLVREILVTRQHEFVRDSGATLLRELVGDGLLTREEPLHRERRRVLQPAFHRDQIAFYAGEMVRLSEELSSEWAKAHGVDVSKEMRKLSLAIVGATLFGADFGESADAISAVMEGVIRKTTRLAPVFAFLEPAALAYRRLFPKGPSLFFRSERARLEEAILPVIQHRRTTQGRDILSLILQSESNSGAVLTDEDAKSEIVTFVLAGHETTATALAWTWHLLAENPDAEQQLQQELQAVLDGRSPGMKDLSQLSYTSAVFKEAMRLYPPALLFARRPRHTCQLAGYTIKAGQSIFLSPYITQRNPNYFPDPDVFLPQRWLAAKEADRFAYFPFGGGAKGCIGEAFARTEGVLVLATLASRWRLRREANLPSAILSGPILPGNKSFPLQLETSRLLPRSVSARKQYD